ncbi:hypothetical protein D9M69_572140 [compost metagenome]
MIDPLSGDDGRLFCGSELARDSVVTVDTNVECQTSILGTPPEASSLPQMDQQLSGKGTQYLMSDPDPLRIGIILVGQHHDADVLRRHVRHVSTEATG